MTLNKIMPCLWFDTHTDEALALYTSIFERSRIVSIKRYPDDIQIGPLENMDGKVLTAIFELAGQKFMALDGGPQFKFTPSNSFFIHCASEAEIDRIWARLTDGGTALMELAAYPWSPKFGWAQDRYGISWQLTLEPRQQQIVPALMFVGDQYGRAEEAMRLYLSLFDGSSVETLRHHTGDGGEKPGTVRYALARLGGYDVAFMDSGFAHQFTFTEAVSYQVTCDTQAEIDRLWETLSAVPEAEACGWLKDRFGVSWQIVPKALGSLMEHPDRAKADRVMQAMLQMKKFDIAALEGA